MTHRVQKPRICATASCARFLTPRSQHDTCPSCRGETSAPPPPRLPRPGTRSLRVTYAASHSGVAPSVTITLPLEPWNTP